uniref:Protein MMS22-like N-terminal domain-containing protein n=1 Tax=Oncorhynchus tshawytscha TaxID=74940 RepID=A0A8C8C6P8_ONCTS
MLVSPFAGESQCELTPFLPPCFSCASDSGREDTRPLSSDSYIGRGSLKHRSKLLLSSKGCCCVWPQPHADYEEDTVDIFGFPWVTETSLMESTKLLYGLFKHLKLETLVQSSSHDFSQASSLHYEAEDLRQQRVLFLQYVKPTSPLEEGPCQPYEELEAQLPSALLEELFGVTLLIVRLKDLPANIQSALTIQRHGKVAPLPTHTKYEYCE